jgi:UPF0755 protein
MEKKAKKPPQFKFDSEPVRLTDTGNISNTQNLEETATESDAPFFAADAVVKANTNQETTRLMDAVAVPVVQPVPREDNTAHRLERMRPSATPLPHPSKKTAPPKPKTEAENQKVMTDKQKRALKKRMKRRKEHTRTFAHIFGSLLLVAFILTSSALLANFVVRAFLDFTGINVVEFRTTVEIPAEATTEEIAEILANNELIALPSVFVFYARFTEKEGDFLNGLFTLSSTMSYSQLIHNLQNRPRSTETVTVMIPEGLTAREIGELLEENGVCRAVDFTEFYRPRMNRFDFERRLEYNPLKFNQMEGFLFPDTYEFFVVNGLEENPDIDTKTYAEVVARTMMRQFNSNMSPEIYRRIFELNSTLPFDFELNEFVTLASIVQREAAQPEDMRNVASVFLNRLRNPHAYPYLESDPTGRYARLNILPYRNRDNEVLLNSIIESFSTYERDGGTQGLPPGPICNPGMDAMLAVLEAPRTDYFFFCAEVETGRKFFARTYAEHQANLREAGLVDAHGNPILQ